MMSDDPKDVRDGVQLSENEEDAIREMMEMLGPWKGRRLGPWRIKDGPAAVKLWKDRMDLLESYITTQKEWLRHCAGCTICHVRFYYPERCRTNPGLCLLGTQVAERFLFVQEALIEETRRCTL